VSTGPALHKKRKLVRLTSYTFTHHLLMGRVLRYWPVTHVTHSHLLTHLTHDPLTHCLLCCAVQLRLTDSDRYVLRTERSQVFGNALHSMRLGEDTRLGWISSAREHQKTYSNGSSSAANRHRRWSTSEWVREYLETSVRGYRNDGKLTRWLYCVNVLLYFLFISYGLCLK